MKVQLVPASVDMIPDIIDNIREGAIDAEIVTDRASIAKDLEAQLLVSTHCFAGMVDGKVAVVWGVLTPSITSGIGIVWAVTTKLADEYPLVFARRSRIELDRIRKDYVELTGYVNAKYERSVQWLGWLGFTVEAARPLHGAQVHRIRMKGTL